jgi:hypothetical protein
MPNSGVILLTVDGSWNSVDWARRIALPPERKEREPKF